LRLQMALSESEEEFKKNKTSEKTKMPQSSSAMEDLLGLNLNVNDSNQASAIDPWGLPVTSSNHSSTLDLWNTNTDVPEKKQEYCKK